MHVLVALVIAAAVHVGIVRSKLPLVAVAVAAVVVLAATGRSSGPSTPGRASWAR